MPQSAAATAINPAVVLRYPADMSRPFQIGPASAHPAIAPGLILTALLAFGCSSKVNDDSIARVNSVQLTKWLEKSPEKYLILDARPREEFVTEHIPGARHVEPPEVDPNDLDPSLKGYKALIVYGENPGSTRARALSKRLIQARQDVYWLEGGISEWKAGGRSTTRAAGSP